MAHKFRSTLTSKGQITLPIALRRRWALNPGDCVDFCLEDDGRVVLRKWLRRSILDGREELPALVRASRHHEPADSKPGS
jgi:AbrB family looped-hinge helix DNA binding protein